MPPKFGRGGRGGASGRGGRGGVSTKPHQQAGVPVTPEEHADPHQQFSTDENASDIQKLQATILSLSAPFLEHNIWYQDAPDLYVSELLMLLHSVDVPRGAKINALLVGFDNKDYDLVKLLLSDTVNYQLPEVLAAARALDAPRRSRCLQGKIADITARPDILRAIAEDAATAEEGGKRKRDAKERERKTRRGLASLATFKQELVVRTGEKVPGLGSTLSGHNCAFFCEWAEALQQEELSHFLLEFGLDLWKDFADMVHIKPSRMKLSCFLPYAFNAKTPLPEALQFAVNLKKNKLTKSMRSNLSDIVKFKVPYGYIKKIYPVAAWDEHCKVSVAQYMPLTTLLWWIEELRCPGVEKLISERLAKGEAPSFGYGKLMERLMYCSSQRSSVLSSLVPVAQQSIAQYSMPLRTPMAVLGDCSGSMQVAVRTSSIIVSLMAALGNAELFFFNNKCVKPPFVPTSIKEVLMVSEDIIADGPTAPAAALEELYFANKRVETLVVVTDEKENDPGPLTNLMFHELLDKYRKQIAPTCYVVLVSFLGATETGEMATKLSALKIPYMQCRLNGNRPDLTKLDMLLGKLSMDTPIHVVATKALSIIVSADKRRLSDAADFTFDFRRDSTKTVVRLLTTAAMCTPLDRAGELFDLFSEFFDCLPPQDEFVKESREKLAKCHGELSLLQNWVRDEWGIAFQQMIEHATSGSQGKHDLFLRKPYNCGTISCFPQEIMGHMLSFLPRHDIDKAALAAPSLARVCHEARFDAKFHEKKGEFDDQIEQIRQMGMLDIFDVETVTETLKRTRGNVDHCIALLFGEGRR